MKSHTHAAAARTSAAWAGSALTEGMRRNSASSTNQSAAIAPESSPVASSPSGHVAKRLRLGEQPQFLERVVLDLADALAGDVERPSHLVERLRVATVEPEPELDDAALALPQQRQRP